MLWPMDEPAMAGGVCETCYLKTRVKHPCIPLRPLADGQTLPAERSDRPAVLCIGEAPGHHEDQQGRCWVGLSGTLLQRFIQAVQLDHYADIYLTNACRCYPIDTQTPPLRAVRDCRSHLRSDILRLAGHYRHLVLFCLGSISAYATVGIQRLSQCFQMQAALYRRCAARNPLALPDTLLDTTTVRCFFTYHPAVLLPSRRPALTQAVQDHFLMLRHYLQSVQSGSQPFNQLPYFTPLVNTFPPADVLANSPILSLDIETYGVLAGQHQSVFHPIKSTVFDHIPPSRQLVSAAIAFLPPDTLSNLEPPSALPVVYTAGSRADDVGRFVYQLLSEWLRHRAAVSSVPPVLLGQNIRFDIQYLRNAYPPLAYLLSPLRFRLEDTLLWSFLLFEQRPENSLKDLAKLFLMHDYQPFQHAAGPFDPALIHYNCTDAVCTAALLVRLLHDIRQRYGPTSPKLPASDFSDPCSLMRNAVLWSTVHLESSGFCLYQPILQHHQNAAQQTIHTTIRQAQSAPIPVTIAGEGSQSSIQTFLADLVRRFQVSDHPQLRYSEKTRQISSSVDNLRLLSGLIPADDPAQPALQALIAYKQAAKLLSTYLQPLLTCQRKGYVQTRPGGILHYYPHWYPIPLSSAKDPASAADTSSGGTIQGRFSCKDPAAQTFPPPVKEALCSRWGRDGVVVGWDLSQIELRVAALLSGDPLMLDEYQRGIDRHAQTGLLIAPHMNPADPAFKPYRQAGKTLNFLVLYLGQAAKFQETLRHQLNIHLPLETCQAAIERFDQRYVVFRRWQQSLIQQAARTGQVVLPTGWSRTFGKGAAAANAVNEIANFPIQTIAAQLMQSAQFAIQCQLEQHHLPARICLQIHDALYIDTPRRDIPTLCAIVEPLLTRPPLLVILEEKLQRSVPILFERTLYDVYTA